MMTHRSGVVGGWFLLLVVGGVAPAAEVHFNRDIRPILSRHCIACHGPDEEDRQAGLRLDTFAGATEDFGGYAAVAPGEPDESELIARVETDDDDLRMPPAEHADPLAPEEVDLLRRWIAGGADYEAYWAFVPPRRPATPGGAPANASAAIDHFIGRRLEEAGLPPNPPAAPHALARRLSLDLTGLPPVAHTGAAADALRAYLDGPRRETLVALVDALLATPGYAEHWASMWLDLARYADTVGYSGDEPRDIWPWRDWLIHAIAQNKSYRDLSIEMLAGDLLPGATEQQRLATGFHRNTLSNNEGGTNDEEFRVVAVKDRLSTTLNTWMGLTVRCAECHSHKYDPISQTEYYQLLDFFNQTADADRRDETPKLPVTPRRDPAAAAELAGRIAALEARLADAPEVWTSRRPVAMTSRGGTEFELLDDDSILATGPNPDAETYEFTFELPPGEAVRAIRLEAIPHLRHDGKTGRSADGAFILSQVRLVRHDEQGDTRLLFADAENDYSQPNLHARTAIKETVESKAPNQGWSTRHPVTGFAAHHEAVFELAEPLDAGSGARFTLALRHDAPWIKLNMGCVRVSTCSVAGAAGRYRGKTLDPVRRELRPLRALADKKVRVPVLEELPADERRDTFVMLRGNYLSRGERVEADFPEAFAPAPAAAAAAGEPYPRNRLGLARWLFAEDNPLTARVAVNRYWSRVMGAGIVETEEDFGTQGSPPSHPELLDYLAVDFRDGGWDARRLLKAIVLSDAYQQSQRATSAALEADPHNRLLSRGPRVRLGAEVVRDQALAVSGLLSAKRFGPPVYPPSPIKQVVNAFTGGMTWQESRGEDRYRRAIYTFLKRSVPHPLFETFDVSSRDVCSLRRLRTNTPLQSFMTLNDVTFIEAARALAERMLAESETAAAAEGLAGGGDRLAAAIGSGLRDALFVPVAPEDQVRVLVDLHARCVAKYQRDPAAAATLVGAPSDVAALSPAGRDALVRRASMTVVANVVLNLDRFLNN